MAASITAWTGLRWQRRSVWTLVPYKYSLDAIAKKVVWTVVACRPTQETNAVAYEQDNSPLQGGAEPAFAEPAPTEINRDKEQKEVTEAPPPTDKRHSQATEPPKPKISKEREVKAWGLIFGLPDETEASRFADHHIAGKEDTNGEAFTVERVAEKVRELCGGDEPLEAYMPWVERCLDDKRAEAAEMEAAS